MICCLVSDAALDPDRLATIARACSPRVESFGTRVVAFDASGLQRVIGSPAEIAREVHALAVEQIEAPVRVAIAPSRVAAWLLAHEHSGITVINDAKEMKHALASLPVSALKSLPGHATRRKQEADAIITLGRWGLRTLGQVASLNCSDVHTRLGPEGITYHQASCGEDAQPLVPEGEPPAFFERCVLEWPIEGLEPLTFVLGRLCEALSIALERADRGAVTIITTLRLVTRATHTRTLNLPAPMRDAKTLRTLIALDLESHAPDAGIDVVTVAVDVVPGRIVQGSLLDRALPAPEAIATLTARLRALMGEARVGAPLLTDTHNDRETGLQMFGPRGNGGNRGHGGDRDVTSGTSANSVTSKTVIRRYRLPIAARVEVERGAPVRIFPSSSSIPAGRVLNRAGPWHSSGRWWTKDQTKWDRIEWDVELTGGGCYRLAKDRATGHWEIDGEID